MLNDFFDRISTCSVAENVSRLLSTKLSYPHIVNAINNVTVKRLNRHSRGVHKDKHLTQIDLHNASRSQDITLPTRGDLIAVGQISYLDC